MSNAVNAGHLRAFVERIERLEEEKKALADDIKDVYAEAKGNGFDPKIIRKVVALRREDADKRREQQEILNLYLEALGMLADTPLGAAAIDRAQDDAKDGVKPGEKRGARAFKADVGAALKNALGTPAPLTDAERAEGYTAAFIGSDGARVTMGVNMALPRERRAAVDAADDDYDLAVAIVLAERNCSTSFIQRRLTISHNKATSLIERMERERLLGPPNHAGKREILVVGRMIVKGATQAGAPAAP